MKKYRNGSPAETLMSLSTPYQLLACLHPDKCETQPELLGKIGKEKRKPKKEDMQF